MKEDYKYLLEKKISLIIWNSDDKSVVRVFAGELVETDSEYYFVNKKENWKVHLDLEQLGRVKEVTEDIKKMLLDADYVISLTLGNLTNDSMDGYSRTYIKWDS